MARQIPALGLALMAILGLGPGVAAGHPGPVLGAPTTIAMEAGTADLLGPPGATERHCTPVIVAAPTAADRRPDAPPVDPALAARRPRPVAAFLGDSYTSGWRGVGEGSESWPAILGAVRHWTADNLAVAGTGFVNPGWTGQPIGSRVTTAIGLRPGIVFVAGGHNDEDLASGPVMAAADAVLDRLANALPHAVIVVVGPIWPDGNPKATLVRLRDHLRSRAAALGALFIDPIGSRWFAGANERFIGPDGTHPTTLGYRRIARLVGAALETDPRLSASLARDAVTAPGTTALQSMPAGVMWASLPGLGPCAS